MIQVNEALNNNVVELFFNTFVITTKTDVYIKSRFDSTAEIVSFDFLNINSNFKLCNTLTDLLNLNDYAFSTHALRK